MTFEDLKLNTSLLKALRETGYSEPTEIQAQVIPEVLSRKDVLGSAQTGTGKTAAFVIPIVHQVMEMLQDKSISSRDFKALILAPTRELALQTNDYIAKFAVHSRVKHLAAFGGVDIERQMQEIKKVRPQILVCTPGRFLELHQRRFISLKHIKFLVLDEADKMLDLGFIEEVKTIERLLPKARQTLFFSATLSPKIKSLAKGMLRKAVYIQTNPEEVTTSNIIQRQILVESQDKVKLIQSILKEEKPKNILIFCATQEATNELVNQLRRNDIQAEAIHGDRSQGVRIRILNEFATNRLQILVATDIAARGLDIQQIDLVVNYHVPQDAKVYVHRIGRTGRASHVGKAYTFVSPEEKDAMRRVIKFIQEEIPVAEYDLEPVRTHPPSRGRRKPRKRS